MTTQALHVAVGVIRGTDKRLLITRRARHAHQGGLWEFPGGKVEADETVFQALRRELREELAIDVQAATPLIKIDHHYPDRQVLLDVWEVNAFSGSPRGCEGQAMRWVAPSELKNYDFPAANQPIINAALLPRRYAILEGRTPAEIQDKLECVLAKGIDLLQLRAKSLPITDIESVYRSVSARCQAQSVRLLLNSDVFQARHASDGLHLSSRALFSLCHRPENASWVAASCHNLAELEQAQRIGVDFVVIAPILPTATHPDAIPLGWEKLRRLIDHAKLPVFALGGLQENDIERAIASGAQGLAGISMFL